MKVYKNVYSSADKVDPIEYDKYHVYINKGIERVDKDGEEGFHGFKIAEQTMYDSDEYVGILTKENETLSDTLNTILTDIIPNIGG